MPYDRWRQIDPEDTLRFYALREHDLASLWSARAVVREDLAARRDRAGPLTRQRGITAQGATEAPR